MLNSRAIKACRGFNSAHLRKNLAISIRSITIKDMYTVKETPEFQDWLDSIRDLKTRIRLAKRLVKVRNGTMGDIEPLGDGISEMREHFGPGWRMYYIKQGKVIIVMLGGGDKSSQTADIKAVKKMLKTLEES
jgi:putative addiction module killer protein